MGTVSLSLVIHNHQPVGNFGWVIEGVFEHAYEPLIGALERHPAIRLGLHYSGPLIDWMRANRPAALARVRALVERGQVEPLGGGYYEPILVALPDRDRHGQLVRMGDEIESLFGRRPRGAWLAERVWEPSLPFDLAEAGYAWTILDDEHLRAARVPEDEMWTAFTTDDRGRQLTVFGTEMGLRYRIPFKPVDDLVEYLRNRRTADARFVGMMGDDGEKFGAWPSTYEYCWSREHWVERCFDALEANRDWLRLVTPSEWLEGHPPTRRIYVPDASYTEMTEWALPASETPIFTHLLEAARDRGLPEARFLRGGFWRNFAARYREINELHKQMLRVSAKVAAMPDGPAKALATDHLYQGQSNDCYWHGLFGGIYIVHMRMATLGHLVAAEDVADAGAAKTGSATYGARLQDTDLDAVDELLVSAPGQTLVVDIAEGAALSSWDLRATRLALLAVIRRRPEAYHQRLIEHERASEHGVAAQPRDAAAAGATDESRRGEAPGGTPGEHVASAPKTIHDMVTEKEPGLATLLHYDRHERRSGLVHLFPAEPPTTLEQLVGATYTELGEFVDSPYELLSLDEGSARFGRRGSVRADDTPHPVSVTKTLRWSDERRRPSIELAVEARNDGGTRLAFELGLEWNLNLLGGGHNPAAYYRTGADPDEDVRRPHDGTGDLAPGVPLAFGNEYEGARIEAMADPPARATWYPVETVSNSEAGFERVYQGSSLLFRWPISLEPGESRSVAVRFAVEQSVDRLAEELD